MSPADAGKSAAGGSKAWIVALAVLALITAIVVVIVLHGTGPTFKGGRATEDTNSSKPTISAWDETSTPTPTTPPPPTESGGQVVMCPYSTGTGKTPQVAGKLTADTLQVDQVPGWRVYDMYLQSLYDTHAQMDEVYLGWMSNIAVGLVSNADGFFDISTTAEMIMECFASSGYYLDFIGREDIIPGEQISISGHPAWRIESKILVTNQRVDGDVTDVIVVDLGPGKDHLGVFFSSYSIGDTARQAKVEAAIASLAVIG